jgi:hypothetical protein
VQIPAIKKGNPSNNEGLPFSGFIKLSNGFYIYSVRAFGPLFNVKRNLIALVERPEPFCIDSGVMYENIRTFFLLDKTITLTIVEPFYNTSCHSDTPFVSVIAIVPYCRMPL